jgi:hypothetical protein
VVFDPDVVSADQLDLECPDVIDGSLFIGFGIGDNQLCFTYDSSGTYAITDGQRNVIHSAGDTLGKCLYIDHCVGKVL